jgi:predicted RNA-binding protein with PUA domain
MEKHTDLLTPTLDMKCQATDICMTEIDATPPADPEKLQAPGDEQDEVVSEQLDNRSGEGTATLTEEMGHGKSATQESADLRGQRKAVGKSSVAHSTENMRYGSTREDMAVEEMETGLMQSASEGIQDDVRLSPKKTKNMEIQKTERTRNTTRRAAYKNGKS